MLGGLPAWGKWAAVRAHFRWLKVAQLEPSDDCSTHHASWTAFQFVVVETFKDEAYDERLLIFNLVKGAGPSSWCNSANSAESESPDSDHTGVGFDPCP